MAQSIRVRKALSLGTILVLVGVTPLRLHAQQCLPSINSHRVASGGYISQNAGYIHYRLRPSCSLGSGVAAALSAAVTAWNERSMGIKVDLLACNSALEADFFVGLSNNPNLTGGCAGVQNGETMWIDIDGVASWAESYTIYAAHIVGHEIGHLLGLDDAGVGTWSIMNNPFWAGDCLSSAENQINSGAPTGPTGSDATTTETCAYSARSQGPIRREPPSDEYYYAGPCYERWYVWTWYNCTTSYCWPTSEKWEYVGIVCGPESCDN